MKISTQLLRKFLSPKADDRQLAEDLTLAGIAVESMQAAPDGGAIFEMEITTNRVDAMNHYGAARECSAIYDIDLPPLAPKLPSGAPSSFKIKVEAPQGCARYTARELRGVKISTSPAAVLAIFAALEQKPINNVADATNLTLLEMGQPTHAFDADKLAGRTIIVRYARAGERLKTLDGVDRTLRADDLVIADAEKAVALAGVMGGFDSMITAGTRNILIESAWFDPAHVRRTSRRLGMHTDASHRFERGADPGATQVAAARVAELVLASGGGEVSAGIDVIAREVQSPGITLSRSEILRILGTEIPAADVERILTRLGFALTPDRTTAERRSDYSVAIPTWRSDVEREIDLIEEIARIYGFNRFENRLPTFSGAVVELPRQRQHDRLRQTLLALGYNEALSSTFIAGEDSGEFSAEKPVTIANPLSEEAGAMRTSLAPGMLELMARNLNRGADSVQLFEAGHVYGAKGEGVSEREAACFAATGKLLGEAVSFFHLKGDVEQVLHPFAGSLTFEANAPSHYHPGRSARVLLDGKPVGSLGQVHPALIASRKIKQDVYLAELDTQTLFAMPLRQPRYERLSRFPMVERDFSFILDDATEFGAIRAAIDVLGIPELRSLSPVEPPFRGGNVPAGKYSLLLRAQFQSHERTLGEEDLAGWSAKVIAALRSLGGTQRA